MSHPKRLQSDEIRRRTWLRKLLQILRKRNRRRPPA